MKKIALLIVSMLTLSLHTSPGVAEQPKLLTLDNLAIPETLGKIQERFVGSRNRWVIHIQDIHAHFAAQENIAAIVDHLNAVYGIQTVAVEGAWKSASFPKSWALPSSREKQMLARALLEDDYITGPVYSALFSQTPVTLHGIEDATLYDQNREIYIAHLNKREAIIALLQQHQEKLVAAKKEVYNGDLQSFDSQLSKFREGEAAGAFIPSLISWAQNREVALDHLDQILLFIQIMAIEATLDKKKLASEAGRLMQAHKGSRLSFEEILRSSKIPEDKLEFYPETIKYLQLMNLQDQISLADFFAQIEMAITRLKEKLFRTDEERKLDARSEAFALSKKIILFHATPEVLNTHSSLEAEVAEEAGRGGLTEALNLGLAFYEIAKTRDAVFFEETTTRPELQGDIAVIAGGFHTEGLSQKFRQADISYIVISPDLSGQAPDEALYFKRLQEAAPRDQTLAAILKPLLNADRFDEGYVRAVPLLTRDRDIFKAKKAVETYQIGLPVSLDTRLPEGVSISEIMGLAPPERTAKIVDLMKNPRQGDQPMLLVLRARDLVAAISNNDAALLLLEAVKQNRANAIVIVGSPAETPLETIGGKYRRIPWRGDNLADVLADDKFKSRFADYFDNGVIAAMVGPDEDLPDQRVLELRGAVALLFRIILSTPELRSFVNNPEFAALLNEIILEIENLNEILRGA
ncbi:MAG: hypothetical protein Q8R76_02315 [Candidatus Omnitrophota bacterium]|nr:hypothetical protein [Candidatus Omnitrophota bacterium]